MKKFFSLVLALVMALSLTTVAWGADPTTVEVETSDQLVEAIKNSAVTTIKLKDGDYSVRFTNNTAFNVDGLTIVGLGDNVNLTISSSEVSYGRIQGNEVVFENINFTNNTVGATGKATYNYCNFAGQLECASSGAAETYAYKCVIGQVHTSLDMNAGAAYFEECEIASAAYNTKATMNFTKCDITDGISIWGGNTILNDCTIDPEKISCVGSGAGTIVMDGSFVASTAAELITAMKAATSGATITLLKDITISDKWDCRTPDKGGVGAQFLVPVTIDGDGHKLTFTGEIKDNNWNTVFRFEDTATVKDLTIDVSAATSVQRGISAKGSIVVENFTFIGNGTTARYGVIFGEGAGAAAIGNVTATVTGSTFKDASYGVSDNRNGQDAKSVTVTGSTFENAKVLLSASEEVVFSGNTVEDASVTITSYTTSDDLKVTATNNTLDANTTVTVSNAATVTTDSNAFIATDATLTAPDGYQVIKNPDGTSSVVPSSSLAPASGAKGAYYTTDMTKLAVYPGCDLANYTYTLENYTVAADAAKTFAKVAIWQTHKVTGAKTIAYTAVVASADSANLAFVNGSSITYLNTNVAKWTATATAVATVDVADAENCGDVFAAGDVGVYTDANGKVYVEDITGAAYNVGGQLVMLKAAAEVDVVVGSDALKAAKAAPVSRAAVAGTVYTVIHDYDCDLKTFNSDKTVTRVFCAECKVDLPFVVGDTADAIKKFGAGNYVDTKLTDVAPDKVYVALTGYSAGGAVVTPSTDKVTSADTFDAGIAMYVGMSVMAAAGSAVVIGKKKD